jgi:MFS family permease
VTTSAVTDRPTGTAHGRRDVGLTAAGVMVSTAGDAATLIALLYQLRAAGVGWVSALLAAQLLPTVLLSPAVGRLVDRVDNRRLLIIGLGAQALIVAPLAFVRSPWLVVLLFTVLTVVASVVRPAVSAMIPALSGEERMTSAYAWVATGSGIGWIVGPAAGGLLMSAFGIRTTLLADAATFVVLAVVCSRLRASRGGHPVVDTAESRLSGTRILWRDLILRNSLLVSGLAIACAVVDNVAAPFRFVDQLGTDATGYGAYLALWGVGALAGTQLPRRLPATTLPMVLAVGNVLCGLGILGVGVAPTLTLALIASVVGGIGNGMENVAVSALVASRVTADARGRAFASVSALFQTATGIGTVAGAPLVAVFAAGATMAGAGGLTVLVATFALVWAWRWHARPSGQVVPPSAPSG